MPPRSQNLQPNPTLTHEQNNTLYNIALQTAELEKQKVQDDVNAAAARVIRAREHEEVESALRIREESQAKIRAMTTPAGVAQTIGEGNKDDSN